jgi:preprotein translocase subunit SecG
VCLCLIGLVLLQRSEGGALGMGGGGGGSLMSGRGAADALARMTSVAGGFFLVTSLGLTVISGAASSATGSSVFDRPIAPITAPATQAPAQTTPAAPAQTPSTTPDPTESSAPQAAETQLASISPGPSQAVAATPTSATRAGPLQATPTQRSGGATVPASAPATQRATTTPSTTTQRSTTPPPATTTTQRAGGTTVPTSAPSTTTRQPATTTTRSGGTTSGAQANSRPLVIPNTSGSVGGIQLTDQAPIQPESVEAGNGVQAVRRERAGPDQ